jgi:hypothetical protein
MLQKSMMIIYPSIKYCNRAISIAIRLETLGNIIDPLSLIERGRVNNRERVSCSPEFFEVRYQFWSAFKLVKGAFD